MDRHYAREREDYTVSLRSSSSSIATSSCCAVPRRELWFCEKNIHMKKKNTKHMTLPIATVNNKNYCVGIRIVTPPIGADTRLAP